MTTTQKEKTERAENPKLDKEKEHPSAAAAASRLASETLEEVSAYAGPKVRSFWSSVKANKNLFLSLTLASLVAVAAILLYYQHNNMVIGRSKLEQMTDKIGEKATAVKEGARQKFQDAKHQVQSAGDSLSQQAQDAAHLAKERANSGFDAAKQKFRDLEAKGEATKDEAKGFFSHLGEKVSSGLGFRDKSLGEKLQDKKEQLQEQIQEKKEQIQSGAASVNEKIKETIGHVEDEVEHLNQLLQDKVKEMSKKVSK